MAAPAFVAVGTPQVGGAAALTVPWPAGHAVDQIALLFMEGATAPGLATANGFVRIDDAPQSATACVLDIYWCRATSTSMASPVTNAFTNHGSAVIITYSGCITTGNPWDVTSGGINNTASTSLSATGDTTTLAECLVVFAAAFGFDSASAQFSGEAAANLTSLAERYDQGTAIGNGGGFGVWDGVRATAGAYGPLTATIANSTVVAFNSIALKPPAAGGVTGTLAATQDANVGAFTGSVGIPGVLAATQDPNVGAFTGTVANPITGTLAATQADNTGAFTGSVGLTGTLAATQADNVGAFTGAVANPITGILGAVQADNVANFTGQTILGGNLTAVQDDNVGAFTGTVANPVTGILGAVQDDNTAAFTGTVGASPITGILAASQDDNVAAFTGTVVANDVTGVLAAVQDPNVGSFTGNVANPVSGLTLPFQVSIRDRSAQAAIADRSSGVAIADRTSTVTISP